MHSNNNLKKLQIKWNFKLRQHGMTFWILAQTKSHMKFGLENSTWNSCKVNIHVYFILEKWMLFSSEIHVMHMFMHWFSCPLSLNLPIYVTLNADFKSHVNHYLNAPLYRLMIPRSVFGQYKSKL